MKLSDEKRYKNVLVDIDIEYEVRGNALRDLIPLVVDKAVTINSIDEYLM